VSSPSTSTHAKKYSACLHTGLALADEIIGGLPYSGITHLYGPAGVGKTTFTMEIYLNLARQGKGTFIIDCGGSYNPRRLLQLCGSGPLPSHHLTIFYPHTFQEQADLISKLHLFLDPTIKLIIIDPFTTFYRRYLSRGTHNIRYRELTEHQLPRLLGLAQDYQLTILLVNQIITWTGVDYPVGGDAISRYALLELQFDRLETGNSANRWLIVKRHDNKFTCRLLLKLGTSGFELVKIIRS
jgi:RecA/RadA recombinase